MVISFTATTWETLDSHLRSVNPSIPYLSWGNKTRAHLRCLPVLNFCKDITCTLRIVILLNLCPLTCPLVSHDSHCFGLLFHFGEKKKVRSKNIPATSLSSRSMECVVMFWCLLQQVPSSRPRSPAYGWEAERRQYEPMQEGGHQE